MAATDDHPSRRPGVHRWFAEVLGPDGQVEHVLAVDTTAYPDRSRQRMTLAQALAEAGDGLVVTTTQRGAHLERVVLAPRYLERLPPLWWAEIRESAAHPPAVNLVAMTGPDVEAGAVLDPTALSNTPARSADQLGAIRWYPATGEVDQVYIQPAHRRRRLGQGVIHAASAVAAVRGWPRLWGDGQRTELGERFHRAFPEVDRVAPLSNLLPPMTPGES